MSNKAMAKFSSTKMPNIGVAPGEKWLICPYDRNHRATSERMGIHMTECRRTYVKKCNDKGVSLSYVNCPWNKCHIVLKMELEYHRANCIDGPKWKIERKSEDAWKDHIPTDRIKPKMPIDIEEWKTDNFEYDPMKIINNECLFFVPSGLPNAEKREWREKRCELFKTTADSPLGGIQKKTLSVSRPPRNLRLK